MNLAIDKSNDDGRKVTENLQKIKHKIVVMSGKGGVGKSTVAVNLAYDLSNRGMNVGLMDVDLHGPSTLKMLDIEATQVRGDREGIFPAEVNPHLKVMSMGFFLSGRDTPVIWRGPVKMGAIRQFLEDVHRGNLDYLIIDMPPGTGDEPLSIAQLIPDSDGTIIITTPQDIALLDSRKAVNFAKILKMPVIGIIETMTGGNGTVRHALEQYNSGSLQPAMGATVGTHAGMSGMGAGKSAGRSRGMERTVGVSVQDKTSQASSNKRTGNLDPGRRTETDRATTGSNEEKTRRYEK